MAQAYQGDIAEEISTTPIAGQLAENTTGAPLRSRVADVAIPCGLLAVPGSADHKCKLPTSAAEVAMALGVSVYLPMRRELPEGADYDAGEAVALLEKGEIWVAVEEAVSAGARVYVRFATNGGLTQKGAFLDNASDPGGGATAAALEGARFASSTTGAGFARVNLNLPN